MKYYTGIGSRTTPPDVCRLMKVFAAQNADRGWTLRSGAAPGADTAFEQGLGESLAAYESGPQIGMIYLPWDGFEGREAGVHGRITIIAGPNPDALPIAEQFHPNWSACKQGARKLHARNVHQVIGFDVHHPVLSKFVVYWKDPRRSSGTDQALRIARHYGVPTFNLADATVRRRIESSLS